MLGASYCREAHEQQHHVGVGQVSDVEGVPLDDDTLAVLADQDVFLIVDEDNVEILERP